MKTCRILSVNLPVELYIQWDFGVKAMNGRVARPDVVLASGCPHAKP